MESRLEAQLSRLPRGKGDHSLRHRLSSTFFCFFLFVLFSLFLSPFRFLNVRDIKIWLFKRRKPLLKRKVSFHSRLRVRYPLYPKNNENKGKNVIAAFILPLDKLITCFSLKKKKGKNRSGRKELRGEKHNN